MLAAITKHFHGKTIACIKTEPLFTDGRLGPAMMLVAFEDGSELKLELSPGDITGFDAVSKTLVEWSGDGATRAIRNR